jgi:nicotinamidase/pyrazinamidase
MTSPIETLQLGDAMLIIDVQNDFCPSGALSVTDGDAVVPVLNVWLAAALQTGTPVYASRDWHPVGHLSFTERGGNWPAHCLQDTPGAAFHSDLVLPDDVVLIAKGTRFDKDQYSAFDDTGLAERLRVDGIDRLWVGGLAQDVCVEATVLEGCAAGFDMHVILDATRPITPAGGEAANLRMREAGAHFETTD